MLCAGGDHHRFGDWYVSVIGGLLAELLLPSVNRQCLAWIDAIVEFGQICVNIDLQDLGEAIHYVIIQISDIHVV